MSTSIQSNSSESDPRPAPAKQPWAQSEVFCIHSYAGESGPPCGWHGLISETCSDEATGWRRCPRCGRTTLMRIPAAR
jgi:hypothetical protein